MIADTASYEFFRVNANTLFELKFGDKINRKSNRIVQVETKNKGEATVEVFKYDDI